MFRTRAFVVPFLILALAAVSGLAQVSTSRLEGTVQDGSGSVIPGAKLEAINTKTQIRATTTTDASGRYIFPSLRPSEYTLEAEAAGFRKAIRSGLVLTAGATVTELIKLEIGAVTDSVVVEANAVRVQTADGQVGRAITLRDIDVLPQLGRNPMSLAPFNAGVQIDVASGADYSRVNGTRQGSSNTTLDGIEVNDPVVPRLGLAMTPSTTDTVEEVSVVTNGGKAEYGRNAGGQIQMLTRSGTNKFHGAAFDYLRNTALNANNFFSNQSRQTRPKFIQNQFGGRFDGPVFKEKTFFMGSYEGRRTRQEVVRNRTVLTPELKSGLFRYKDSKTGALQSYDIAKNDPRKIGFDAAVKGNLALLPDPNNYDLGDTLNTAGYRFNAPANSFNDQYTFKVDHNLWNGNRTFFRWSWMRTYAIDSTNSSEASFPGMTPGMQGGHRMGWSVGSDWTLNATTVNELRVGGQKSNSDFLRPQRLPQPLLYSNTFTDPIPATDWAQGRTVPFVEVTDHISKILGKHTVKFGGDTRFTTQEGWRVDFAWPVIYSNTTDAPVPATVGPQGNISSADLSRFQNHYNELLGRVAYSQVRYYSDLEKWQPAGTARSREHKFREFGFFAQDDWKLRPNFTLNLGVRWDYFGVPIEANGLQGNYDKVNLLNRISRISDLTVVKGAPFYNPDKNNFAPRVGFAWDVRGDGKTAIRGAWGVFYDRMINATLTPVDNNTPGFNQDVRAYPGGDYRYSTDGLPVMAMPAAPVLQVPANRQSVMTVMDPNLRTGYVMHTSFTVSQEIFRNTVVDAAYVGTRGVKLFMQVNLNQPRMYEDFLPAFRELQAFNANKTPVSANNTLVKIFGTPAAAVTAIGAANLANGTAGAAADSMDRTRYTNYVKAGVSDTYLRNFPQFNQAYYGTNDGRSQYDSFQLSFRRDAGSLKFSANYTYSKSIDNWANEGNGTSAGSVMDYANLALNRGRSDFDKTHGFNATSMYSLPFGQGRRFLHSAPRWLDSMFGGWELGLMSVWQSGSPLTLTSGRVTGPNPGANTWINYSGDRTIGGVDRRLDGVYFFTDAQRTAMSAAENFPKAGEIGTSGRNTFRGPRFFNIDASLLKRFRVTETSSFTFRAEAYNVLNNVNFANPALSILNPASFGRISGTYGNARIMQAALRFDF